MMLPVSRYAFLLTLSAPCFLKGLVVPDGRLVKEEDMVYGLVQEFFFSPSNSARKASF